MGLEEMDGEVLQARNFPFEITMEDLERGRERYNIYCSVCHGLSGNGEGMVVRRGYKAAPGYHSDKLRDMPHGYFYSVIVNGYGQMGSYAAQIPVEDRWRIIAYIRALQRSQFASIDDYEAVKARTSHDETLEIPNEHH
jgi:mono/diheme cytochrome c family protein